MRNLLFFPFAILIVFHTSAQQDSLGRKAIDSVFDQIGKIEHSDPKASLAIYLNTLEFYSSEQRHTNKECQRVLESLANFYSRQGLYDEALQITMDLENNSKTDRISYLEISGLIYSQVRRFDTSLKYYNKYLDRLRVARDTFEMMRIYFNLSDNFIQTNQPEEAIRYLSLGRSIMNPRDTVYLALYHHNLGVSYRELGDFEQSHLNLSRALKLDRPTMSNYDLAYDYYEFGNLFRAQNNLQKALIYYDSASLMIDPSLDKEIVLNIYRAIYSTCELLNEYKKGLENSLKYTALRDSIFSAEKVANLATLDLKNYLLQKQKEEDMQLTRTRTIQYSAVSVALLLVVFSIFYLGRFNISAKVLGSTIFITLLLMFEFLLLVIEPFVVRFTGNTPIFVLVANFVVALLFIPIHRSLETWFEMKILRPKRVTSVNADIVNVL